LMNWLFRLLGRLALRAQQFPKQQFINEMYEGALWLPHKVLSYPSLRSLDCVRLRPSSGVPHQVSLELGSLDCA
jgi:hypothetical protein